MLGQWERVGKGETKTDQLACDASVHHAQYDCLCYSSSCHTPLRPMQTCESLRSPASRSVAVVPLTNTDTQHEARSGTKVSLNGSLVRLRNSFSLQPLPSRLQVVKPVELLKFVQDLHLGVAAPTRGARKVVRTFSTFLHPQSFQYGMRHICLCCACDVDSADGILRCNRCETIGVWADQSLRAERLPKWSVAL